MLLDHIPFTPDIPALFQQLGLEAENELADEVAALTKLAAPLARPRALFREAFIEARGEETVTLEGITFTSRVLRTNLEGVERVFPYVITCGPEFDAVLEGSDDKFLRFALDCIKESALWAASEALRTHLESRYGLEKKSSMNPGSGDVDVWPIEQQAELFALLGEVRGQTGVQLTDTFLMHPNKTVSGIYFPTEVDFITCQLCHRADCPNRRAPFNELLWRQKQGK